MITRIGAVVVCILSAVWLARAPDWEPLIAFLTTFGSYLGIEFAQNRKKDGDKQDAHGEIEKPKSAVAAPKKEAKDDLAALGAIERQIILFLAEDIDGSATQQIRAAVKCSDVEFVFHLERLQHELGCVVVLSRLITPFSREESHLYGLTQRGRGFAVRLKNERPTSR